MIKNISKYSTLAKEHKVVKGAFGKAMGLMFCSKVRKALVFEFQSEIQVSLHMLFVFCAIDVVLADSKKRVVGLKEHFMPFTSFCGRKPAKWVIELEEGAIARSRTRVGDIIEFQ